MRSHLEIHVGVAIRAWLVGPTHRPTKKCRTGQGSEPAGP